MARPLLPASALTIVLTFVLACTDDDIDHDAPPDASNPPAAAGSGGAAVDGPDSSVGASGSAAGGGPDSSVDASGSAGTGGADAATPPASPEPAGGPSAPGVMEDFACEVELMPGVCAWVWGTRNDAAFDVAVDSTGAVLVCGRAANTNDYDAMLRKYVGGELAWEAQWGLAGGRDVAQTLALTGGDGVYVAGMMREDPEADASKEDTMLTKLDNDGRVLWTRHFGTAGFYDRGEAVVVDGEGRAHVLSLEFPDDVGRVVLRKYEPDDAMTWAVDWGAPGGTSGMGLALDRAGNSYVVGSETAEAGGTSDGYLSKRMPDGSEAWTVRWGDPAVPDLVTAVALAEDAIYVTGTTRTNLTGDDPDGGAFLMRFTLDGEREWASQWRTGTGTSGIDVAQAVTVGPDGRVYVSGSVRQDVPIGSGDAYAGIFDAITGEELWRLVLQGWGRPGSTVIVDGVTYQTREHTDATGIAVDAAGNIYLAGDGAITAPPKESSPQGAFLIRIEAPELH